MADFAKKARVHGITHLLSHDVDLYAMPEDYYQIQTVTAIKD
jgi:hypothetical protein